MALDYSKWKRLAEKESLEEEDELQTYQRELVKEPMVTMDDVYAKETGRQQVDRLMELKLQLAVEAYEASRDRDTVMHHYWVKEAGDPEAVGEYFPTGEDRDGVPLYRNQHGLVLSREQHGKDSYSWVIGSLQERRPLYGAQCDDLSAPTLGWQVFTAPEPLPVVRYYTQESAARKFKDRGKRCFARREWKEAEAWYSQALRCDFGEEQAEPYALLYSNRSEARLRLQDFRGAAEDADEALRCLAQVEGDVQQLRHKTVLRLARALQAMQRMTEAMRLLHQERQRYPDCPEMKRLQDATRLALRALGRAEGSEKGRRLVEYVAAESEAARKELQSLKSGAFLPASLARHLGKLEYLLQRARQVEEGIMEDVQSLLQTDGLLRCLLNLLEDQWKSQPDSYLDLYRMPAAFPVASLVALICEDHVANLRFVAPDSVYLWALLGGCNCKVPTEVCELLLSLVCGLYQHCRQQTLELIGPVVERVAFFLSQAIQADGCVLSGADAPELSLERRKQAARLLLELLGQKRSKVLRGALPQLAGLGHGFFESPEPAVRTLGELVARHVIEEPQLVEPQVLAQLLQAVQRMAGDDGRSRYCGILLELVSRALEHKLLTGRELERGAYEAAFHAGDGLALAAQLLERPALAEHALRALAAMAQTYLENVEKIVALGACGALARVARSVEARRYAARALMQCSAGKGFLDAVKSVPGWVDEVTKLAMDLWHDGLQSAEAFQDMMYVFHATLQRPAILGSHLRAPDMLQLLLRLEKSQLPIAPLASEVLQTLRKDRGFKQALKPLLKLYEEGYDPDLELRLRS